MGELPEGWSRDVILPLFPSSCAAWIFIRVMVVALEPSSLLGHWVPFYLKLPGISWRGRSNPGSSAKPVSLGKRGDKGPGDRPSGTKG